VTGVVLSGSRDDGAFGLAEIHRQGGHALVQDFREALYPSMPQQARQQVPDARAVPVAAMGSVLAELLDGLPRQRPRIAYKIDAEDAMAALDDVTADQAGGVPAGFGCPSCHGALFEMPGAGPRYRCRVGHAWTGGSLMEELGDTLEGALWMALRSLEEKAALSRRMSLAAEARGDRPGMARFAESGDDAEEAGRTIRRLIDRLAVLEGEQEVPA